MSRFSSLLALVPILFLPACGGGDDNPLDIPAKIEALEDCLPDLYPKVEQLQQVAALWRLNQGSNPPNPAGLTSVINGNVLDVTYVVGDCTITMEISFWSPDGAQQSPDFSGADPASLSDQFDVAATWLADQFGGPGPNPFALGRWTLAGIGVSGGGNLLGSIGGVTNQNELEYLRTTGPTPAGGEPPAAASIVTNTTLNCEMTFLTDGLSTDTAPGQDYADGVVEISVSDGNETANGTITFDSTNIAVIKINGVPGDFDFNLDTYDVTYNP